MASKYAITKFGNTRAGQTILIKNKYQLREDKKLGSGGFGEVYEGINLATRSAIAIKIVIIFSTNTFFLNLGN